MHSNSLFSYLGHDDAMRLWRFPRKQGDVIFLCSGRRLRLRHLRPGLSSPFWHFGAPVRRSPIVDISLFHMYLGFDYEEAGEHVPKVVIIRSVIYVHPITEGSVKSNEPMFTGSGKHNYQMNEDPIKRNLGANMVIAAR